MRMGLRTQMPLPSWGQLEGRGLLLLPTGSSTAEALHPCFLNEEDMLSGNSQDSRAEVMENVNEM